MEAKTMQAYRLVELGRQPVLKDVPVPKPGFGQVLIKMAGAGLCHTDLLMTDKGMALQPWIGEYTLGHENAGWVEEVGPGVNGFQKGEAACGSRHL